MAARRVILLMITIIILIFSSTSFATIGVNTMYIPFEVSPNMSKEFQLKVYNSGPEQDITISYTDCALDVNGYYQILNNGDPATSVKPYLQVSPTTLTIGTNMVKPVTVKVSIPDAVKGPHWGVLLVQGEDSVKIASESTNPNDRRLNATISTALGILVAQWDSQDCVTEGAVTDIKAIKSENGYTVYMLYTNAGSTYQTCTAYIEITSAVGEVVNKVSIDNFFVLPGGQRLLKGEFPSAFAEGKYLILGVVDKGSGDLVAAQQLLVIKGDK